MPNRISKGCGFMESTYENSNADAIQSTLFDLCPSIGKVLCEALKISHRPKLTSYLTFEAYRLSEYRQANVQCIECEAERE